MAADEERLVVLLEARVRDFERNFARAQQTADKRFKAIEDRAKSSATRLKAAFAGIGGAVSGAAGALGAAAGIGGLGLAGLFAGAKTAAADLAQIAAEAQKAGVAVEAFQELGYAAQGALVNIDALTDGVKELQLRADEFIVTGAGGGAEAFQRLGYTADDLKTKLQDPAALFEEIIEKLGRLDKASQIRISDELFGGTGGEQFVRLLSQGNGYIARMRQEARDTGNVLDAELIQRAVEIDRQFAKLATTVGTQLKGALVGVVALMRDFTDMLNSTETQTSATLQRRIDLLTAAAENMRKSSMAFALGGGEDGIKRREAEAAALQAQLDSRPPRVTVNPSGVTGGRGDLSNVGEAHDLAKAYDQIVQSAEGRIAQMAIEQQALGLTTAAAETLRVKQELLAEAQRAGITLTADQSAKLEELAQRSGVAAGAFEQAALSQARLQETMLQFEDISYDAVSGFVSDLRAGVDAADALQNSLNRVLDTLIEMALQESIKSIFSSLSAPAGGAAGGGSVGGGLISSIIGMVGSAFGFAEGGFTGAGGKHQPAGVVHRGEYVFSKAAVGRIGAGNLDALHKGYAEGGYVAPGFAIPQPGIGSSNGGSQVNVTVNNSAGAKVDLQQSRGPNGETNLKLQIDRAVESAMVDQFQGRGRAARVFESAYGVRRSTA
ncbi:hypothetical protein [Ancylobacter vacuolatus]|uniref:Phage tail tape measure protein, lambda family n=1 Tax=Ancylobacter vacuolatus TaxID=223389 RepID=A0ABU0DHG6_9HYPH|nr:hypothetical protein [Ancylobacter vacuolatus]MDQ0347867.1 hypothetical protein [Ancylobacter vacuolatus]